MLALKERNSDFGLIDYTQIGDVEYAYISTPSVDGLFVTYYCWSTEMQGKYRQVFKFILTGGETIDNLLAGFSLIG